MAIWLRGLEHWYLVLGGVAVGRGFEPQSDLEHSFAKILIYTERIFGPYLVLHQAWQTLRELINLKLRYCIEDAQLEFK
jgi:hypothetical protein